MTTKTTETKSRSKASTTRAKSKTTRAKSTADTLPANPFIFEVFSLLSKQRSNAKKVQILKKYEHPALKALLIWNFDESVISLLPTGDVPYASAGEQTSLGGTVSDKIDTAVSVMEKENTNSLGASDQGKTSIRKEYKKFYNFIKGGNDSLTGVKRETMFINLLEGLHPLEAELLILVKDKKLSDKYKITKEIVSQSYPDIVWGNRS